MIGGSTASILCSKSFNARTLTYVFPVPGGPWTIETRLVKIECKALICVLSMAVKGS